MVCPKLEYPLAVTQFHQLECDEITSPVLRACLAKMGYNANMPREVVYGPVEMGGLGAHDYFIEQGIRQVSTLVGHIRQRSETGALIRSCLQWCQIQAGSEFHLLETPEFPVDYIETCWIMNVRDFLRTYKLRLEFTTSVRQSTQCIGDEFLMDALRVRGDCTATELQRLNACRMSLKVARLSDITKSDGTALRQDVLNGKSPGLFLSKDKWPRQGRPPKDWWRLWRSKLRRVFSVDSDSPKLWTKLGKWLPALDTDEWEQAVLVDSKGRSEVYIRRSDSSYEVLAQCSTGGRMIVVSPKVVKVMDRIPAGAVPAELGHRWKNGTRCVYWRPQSHMYGESLPLQSMLVANQHISQNYCSIVTYPMNRQSTWLTHCVRAHWTSVLMADC